MGRYRAEVERDFLDAYPGDFLRDAVRALHAIYPAANQECRANYPPAIAHDLYPQVRYAMIERELLAIAENYEEITATSEANRTRNSYYTLLSSKNIFLTANVVDHPNRLIRYARFRDTYAQLSSPNLFGEPPQEGDILYGILLHGPEVNDRAQPEFAHIVFPNRDCSEYVGRIDLLASLAIPDAAQWATQEEHIPDTAYPSLRPGVERKSEEEGAEDQTG